MGPASTWRTCATSISSPPRRRREPNIPAPRPVWQTCFLPRAMPTNGTRPHSGIGTCVCKSRPYIGAGVADLNAPYFNLYRENLPAIENWTRVHMNGRPGACVPETMRFNGQGIEYESSWDSTRGQKFAYNCAAEFTPYYNARTLSTGAEVSLWIWRQYLATDDRPFLAANYPVMAASARFLLSYQQLGPDGLLHNSPSNAHENQWDVTDPTTDIAAAAALYPVTIQAAQLLGRDSDLVQLLQAALPKIPPLPRTQLTRPFTLLPSAADAAGADMIAESYLSDARNHNGENTGLIRLTPAPPP